MVKVRETVIGLARDLRGIAFAFNTKVSYMMLFDWIYPAYTPILHRAVEIWFNDPQVKKTFKWRRKWSIGSKICLNIEILLEAGVKNVMTISLQQVTTPILKLFAELVQNRSQRLLFDVSSPNGILLFREASKIIRAYG